MKHLAKNNFCNLGDVATYINGYAFKPTDWGTKGLPIIRIQDLTGNSYQANYFSGEVDNRFRVHSGDILISWSASLGVFEWHGGDAVLNQHIFKVVFNKMDIDKKFFIHQLKMLLERFASEAHGATMKHLTRPVFNALPFYAPSLSRQQEIASILERLSNLIAINQQRLSKLDQLVKSRFIEMFGKKEFSKRILIDLIEPDAGLSYGIVQPGDDGTGDMGVLRPIDLVDGGIATDSIKYIDRSIGDGYKRTELTGKEILISVRGTTGITAITDSRFAGMNVTRGIAVIRFNTDKVNPVFLNAAINEPASQTFIQEHTRGATLKQINLSDLRQLPITLPPLELQNEFAAFIEQLDKSKVIGEKQRFILEKITCIYIL